MAIAKIAHSRFALTNSIHIILIKNKKNRHTHTHIEHEHGMTDSFNNARNSSSFRFIHGLALTNTQHNCGQRAIA